jgi:hypothetical protein
LFGAAAIALRIRGQELGAAARNASAAALCVGVLVHSYVFGAILQHDTFVGGFSRVYFNMSAGEARRYQELRSVAALIPPKASVAATELEIPHVATRLDAYTLKITAGDADYIFIHRHHFDSEARQQVKNAMKHAKYGLVIKKGDFYLLAKDKVSPETDNAFRTLGLPTH